ncbi:MAG: aldehyde dehydrogenase, partial [Chloroflexi bacterium]|nr:aldehyde dehydrogenase [Chloroflexota bacterium]
MTKTVKTYWQNFIDGKWGDGAKGGRITVENPATGEMLAEIAEAVEEDVNAAVGDARRCVDS